MKGGRERNDDEKEPWRGQREEEWSNEREDTEVRTEGRK